MATSTLSPILDVDRADAGHYVVTMDAPAYPEHFQMDIAVIGLGYVGLPTALAFHCAGVRVLGLDSSRHRLDLIAAGQVDLVEGDRIRLDRARVDDKFVMSSDPGRLSQAAAVIVCVPTPVDEYQTPSLDVLRRACATVVENARPGQTIILTSTTYVGSTQDMLVAPLAARGLVAGRDIHVAFSPERIDPGNDRYAHEDVPRVVGGATAACAEAAARVLSRYARRVHPVATPGAAEMTKLLENTFRAVNIALANEFADICRTMDLDVIDIIEAAATKPYGFMPFFPGPGVGGHCIPCDPHYLLWQLRKRRLSIPVVEHAMAAIAGRPGRIVDRVRETLSEHGRGLVGARVLVVGVAYKPDVQDLRESPALEILASLSALGASVAYFDPFFPDIVLPSGEKLFHLDDPAAYEADLVLLHTRHSGVDIHRIVQPAQMCLDATYTEPVGVLTTRP